MKEFSFTRIDDRLIHGQVVAAWLRAYDNVTRIMVIDDKVCQDPFMHEMFSLLVPSGITIEIRSVDEAIEKFKAGLEKPTMVIVKSPLTIKRLVDGGIEIPFINIGGIGMTLAERNCFRIFLLRLRKMKYSVNC